MKKGLAILSIIIVTTISALFVIPAFFKEDILRIIQHQVSKRLNAELNIGTINLSMFKSFPDLNVSLKEISITGNKEFSQDTLLHIPLFEASINFQSLISGEKLIINKMFLKNTRFLPLADTNGVKNWDILLPEKDPVTIASEPSKVPTTEEKRLMFQDITIENLYIGFNDYQTSTYASIGHVNFQLSGDFSAPHTVMRLFLNLDDISYRRQNNVWINKTHVEWQTEIAANFQEKKFEIQKNKLIFNRLNLNLTGSIFKKNDKYLVDLHLNAPDTKFENLLSLIPQTRQHHIAELKTSGDFHFDISAKGEYTKNHLPALHARLEVNNASIQYPNLPESIQNIQLDLNITNPGNLIDSTHINLKKLHFNIAGNPFHLFLDILNPKNPLLKGKATGTINFANLKKALPLENITLQGVISTDIAFDGKYQYIEKEEYEKFIAKGYIQLTDILFVNKSFPQGISIPQGKVIISPNELSLNHLQAKIFSSDFQLQGKFSNYLPYLFKNETLKGNFSLISNQLNLNEFIIAQLRVTQKNAIHQTDSTSTTSTSSPNATEGALEIPENIDVKFSANINTIRLDRLNIKNTIGNIHLVHAVADLKNLSMNMLNGNMVLNGQYNTTYPKKPKVDFNLNITDFDIRAAYHAFTFIRKSIPVAMNCEGSVSASMRFAATLDQAMSPIMTTANGKGFLESQGILIKENPAMNQLASVLKNDELNRLSISHLKINFNMERGNIMIEPFKTSFAGNPVTVYGNQSVDGQLAYTLSMTVHRNFFGQEINNLLKSIPGGKNIKTLDLDAKISGTLTQPVIKPDLSKAIKAVTKEAEKELKGNLFQGLQNLFKNRN